MEPREEGLFFAGYGEVEIEPEALIYYCYERIIEDIGTIGRSVFLAPDLDEQAREKEVNLLTSFFAPCGMVETAETVISHRRTNPSD